MISLILSVLIAALLFPLAVCWWLWLLFAVLAAFPRKDAGNGAVERRMTEHGAGKMDILIPAHDEELVLPGLLESLEKQTAAGKRRLGRVMVVADFCSDQTAAIARRFGADVLERSSGARGKPAALRDGLAMLNGGPGGSGEGGEGGGGADFVMLLDADCIVSENFLEEMGEAMDRGYAVAQAAYVLESRGGGRGHTPGTIAFGLKNFVRPLGMSRLGIATQLFGTGMCFRGELLKEGAPGAVRFSDHLTEDLAVSHDLLLRGIGPVFVPGAMVRSAIPEDRRSMATQKLRWETGQVHTWFKLPGMLLKLMLRGELRGILALLDWSAPPVAMGVVAWGGILGGTVVLVLLRVIPWPMVFAPVGVFVLLAGYVVIGTLQLAGVAGVLRLMLAAPRFFWWKLGLYGRMLTGRGPRAWEKTARALPPEVRP